MWSAIKTEETDYGHCLWLVNVISASSGNILLTVIYKNKLQMFLFDVEHEVGLLILLIAVHFYNDSIYLTDCKYRCYFLFYFLLSWTWWNNHLYHLNQWIYVLTFFFSLFLLSCSDLYSLLEVQLGTDTNLDKLINSFWRSERPVRQISKTSVCLFSYLL